MAVPDAINLLLRSREMPHADGRYNRDEDQKPASPPRSATEPEGAKGSSRSAKTATDPQTGEPRKTPPKPA